MTCQRNDNATSEVAVVAAVAVKRKIGESRVERVCVAHDGGQIINTDGTANQIEVEVIQTVSRTLIEQLRWWNSCAGAARRCCRRIG